jgi:hypothetical protein
MNCPGFERLIDFLDDRLDEADAERIAAHLSTNCNTCDESRNWYLQVKSIAAGDDSIGPPSWVFKRAVRIFETARRPRLTARVGQAIASLVFDSFAGPTLAGVRATETANRQLLYSAGDYTVDLQVAAARHARADLMGQVLTESETTFDAVSGLKLDISRGGNVIYSVKTDEMGEFKFTGLEYGVYDLRVELSEGSITIPDLPVSESQP